MKSFTIHTILLIFILAIPHISYSQDEKEDEHDLDAMWENTIWDEIEEVTTVEYEVEKVTQVAGVRGAEAEDEALHHLYYRKTMKGLTLEDLQKAYGKLKNKRDELIKINSNHPNLPKMNNFLVQLERKMKKLS